MLPNHIMAFEHHKRLCYHTSFVLSTKPAQSFLFVIRIHPFLDTPKAVILLAIIDLLAIRRPGLLLSYHFFLGHLSNEFAAPGPRL